MSIGTNITQDSLVQKITNKLKMKFIILVLALISAASALYVTPFGYSAYTAPVVSTYSAAPYVASPYVAPAYGYGYGYSAYAAPAWGVDLWKKKA